MGLELVMIDVNGGEPLQENVLVLKVERNGMEKSIIKRKSKMCKWGTDLKVTLCEPMPYSKKERIKVDACLAPLVQILNDYGIKTMASCCGHGKTKKSSIRISSKNVLITKIGDGYSIHLEFPHIKDLKDLTGFWLMLTEILQDRMDEGKIKEAK